MDTHDVSAEYAELLRRQKQILSQAQSRVGQRPPAREPRAQTIFQFRLRLMARQAGEESLSHLLTSFAPLPYAPCVQPLHNLGKVMINDLLLETHHRGNYLILRSVTPQDRMAGVSAIVEDEHDDVLSLQLYHQEEEDDSAAAEVVVEGMVMIVKEPYLKTTSDGSYRLRVDHLGDIMFLSSDDDRVPSRWQRKPTQQHHTAMAWKTEGNNSFARAKFQAAIEFYTRALACYPTTEEAQTIRLNRSLAFLKTKQFNAALSDAQSATATMTTKPAEKALFRKGQALYSLQRYRECCEVLKALRLEYPDNTAAKGQLDQAIKRLAEQTHGKYRFKQLHAEAAELRPPHLDHATYIGPVEVRPSPHGRGLFTTKAVRAGDILFCEKAFTHAFADDERGGARSSRLTVLVNAEDNSATVGAQADLLTKTIQKLYRNPSLAPTITDLHHGSYKPVQTSEVDGTPVVDTFLIRKIISLNSFGCPLSSLPHYLHSSADREPTSQTKDHHAFHSCGVWPTASYINHACLSTARRAFIGDIMIVRATQDLAPDTEVTIWYQAPDATSGYAARQQKLRAWGFVCDCVLCRDEKECGDGVLAKRKSLRADFQGLMRVLERRKANAASMARADAVIADMAATYTRPASEVPLLAVWDMQLALAQACWLHGQPTKAVEWALAALKSLGCEIDGGVVTGGGTAKVVVVKRWGLMVGEGVIGCWMLLRNAYRLLAPGLADAAEGYARVAYRICFGEDETFETTFGDRS